MTLRLSNFGIRGFVGASLTPRTVMDYASAFATFLDGGRVLVGRDTRQSSPMLHAAALSSLVSAGCEVVDLGICPTPVLQFAVPRRKAAGAISISGGHNGMGWNALTLIGPDGAILEPSGGETVMDIYHGGDFRKCPADALGAVHGAGGVAEAYFQALVERVNVAAIRAAGLKVLIDPVGGAGCALLEPFARHLGFQLIAINGEPSGYLARDPEPRPRNALQMAAFIKHVQGHVGFVLSSDMVRLSVVTEAGEPASEEFTFALVANHVLGRTPGPVVTNCCTSRMVDDLAARHGVPVVKTPVGQAWVVSRLTDEAGVLGGEGSGSVALPAFSRAFDGFLAMALILEAMAEQAAPASALIRKLPRYHIVKRSVVCASPHAYHALDRLRAEVVARQEGRADFTDGLRLDWDDGWVHVRASRTQQLVRVISEARRRDAAERRADEAIRTIEQAL